jgi:hypothetical protein
MGSLRILRILMESGPVAIYAPPGEEPDRGVTPDVVIDYSIEDLKKQSDKEFDKVKD